MLQRKIKLLGIAPYEGMRISMTKLAQQREDLELDVFLGDMELGVSIVNSMNLSEYDAIISRGGTAEAIQKATSLPVIEVPISIYDILRAIKQAKDATQKYAMVGFPSITEIARILYDLLDFSIDIYTIHEMDELHSVLKKLKADGCYLIICDMISSTIANREGISSILVSSGDESIQSSFDEAVKLSKNSISAKSDTSYCYQLLQAQTQKIIDYSPNGQIYLSTISHELQPLLYPVTDAIRKGCSSPCLTKYKKIGSRQYRILRRPMEKAGEVHDVFFIDAQDPLPAENAWLQYKNDEDFTSRTCISSLGSSSAAAFQKKQLESYNSFAHPVLITGEPGVRKSEAAGYLYTSSSFSRWPYIIVDCQFMNEANFNLLTQKDSSPLLEPNCTFFFRGIQKLSFSHHIKLLEMLKHLSHTQTHRFIFSYALKAGETPAGDLYNYLIHDMMCLQLDLAPLRSRKEDIAYFSNLYINQISLEISNQIIGFEPEALQLLTDFPWKENINQLHRVLRTLISISASPYITADDAKDVLSREAGCVFAGQGAALDSSMTLYDFNRQLALLVVEEENGNHSRAAKRLGVSRSTLWRMLK